MYFCCGCALIYKTVSEAGVSHFTILQRCAPAYSCDLPKGTSFLQQPLFESRIIVWIVQGDLIIVFTKKHWPKEAGLLASDSNATMYDNNQNSPVTFPVSESTSMRRNAGLELVPGIRLIVPAHGHKNLAPE